MSVQLEPTGSEGPGWHWVAGETGLMVGGRPNQRPALWAAGVTVGAGET